MVPAAAAGTKRLTPLGGRGPILETTGMVVARREFVCGRRPAAPAAGRAVATIESATLHTLDVLECLTPALCVANQSTAVHANLVPRAECVVMIHRKGSTDPLFVPLVKCRVEILRVIA